MFANVENDVRRDKIVTKFSLENQKQTQSLVVHESRDRRDRISDKNSRKRRRFILACFFFQKWVRIHVKSQMSFFAREKTNVGGGGFDFKTGYG